LNAIIAAVIVLLTFLLVLVLGIGISYAAAMFFLRLVHPPQKPQATLTAAHAGSGD
jgi:CBS-domain-containing membrane protein